MGVIRKIIEQGKIAGRGVLIAGPPGTGRIYVIIYDFFPCAIHFRLKSLPKK